ncbi:S-adenosyl-L-methionine-dependent methyltransferase, partial [Pilobolus umbonatus]
LQDMTTPHPTAYHGFQSEADAYEAVEMVCQLLKDKSKHILDLGAGTGIMTKLLVEQGFQVTAVEPVDNMRYKLMELLPDVPALKGTAWNIPVESASQDMIMLAQCFHWFDDIQSLREFYRVLKPGGIIVLIWNMESKERCEWVRRLRDYYEVYDGSAPQYRKGTWKHIFNTEEAEALFHPLQHKRFQFDTPAKRSDIWTRIQSKSYVAILDKKSQNQLHEDVEKVINDPQYNLPKDDNTPFIYKHDTDMYWTSKK